MPTTAAARVAQLTRMCARKRQFFSQFEAMEEAANRVATGKVRFLRAYQCPHCHGWHLTSKRFRHH